MSVFRRKRATDTTHTWADIHGTKEINMQQLTFAASIAGLLMLGMFAGAASFFDGGPFETPMDSLYAPPAGIVALSAAR